jgi:hypothetical protein
LPRQGEAGAVHQCRSRGSSLAEGHSHRLMPRPWSVYVLQKGVERDVYMGPGWGGWVQVEASKLKAIARGHGARAEVKRVLVPPIQKYVPQYLSIT